MTGAGCGDWGWLHYLVMPSCNPNGRVGSGIGKTYELLNIDLECH